jgi:hypothetical protein
MNKHLSYDFGLASLNSYEHIFKHPVVNINLEIYLLFTKQ